MMNLIVSDSTTFETASLSQLVNEVHNNISIETIEDTANQYLSLMERSGNIRNKARYILASIIEKIEQTKGKQAKLDYLNKTFGKNHSHVYSWIQTYNFLKDKSEDVLNKYLESAKTGVTIFQYLNTLTHTLNKSGIDSFSDLEIIEIIDKINENDLNISNSKNLIHNDYLKPKIDSIKNTNSNDNKLDYLIEKYDTRYLTIKVDNDTFEIINSILELTARKHKLDFDINNPTSLGEVLRLNIINNYMSNS